MRPKYGYRNRRKEMALLSKKGKSFSQIAKKYNLSLSHVKKLLKQASSEGFDIGELNKPQMTIEERENRAKDMALLNKQGFSMKQIAAKYNISRQRVGQILKLPLKELKKIECIVCQKQFLDKHRPDCKTCSKNCQKKIQKLKADKKIKELTKVVASILTKYIKK